MAYARYVAIGDSATEGLMDELPDGSFRGWPDRLAEILAASQSTPLAYANLGIRGMTVNEIRTNHFDQALAMEPDLISIVGGVNDVISLNPDFESIQNDLAAMFGEARAAGATVLTITTPDPAKINPLGSYLRERMIKLNEIVRAEANRYQVGVLDLDRVPTATDPRLWHEDRLHGTTLGHKLLAAGFASLLGLSEYDEWSAPLPDNPDQLARRQRIAADFFWARDHFGPWMMRGLRGISHGEGIKPKQPTLRVVSRRAEDPDPLARDRRPSASGPGSPDQAQPSGTPGSNQAQPSALPGSDQDQLSGSSESNQDQPSGSPGSNQDQPVAGSTDGAAHPGALVGTLAPVLSVADPRAAAAWYAAAFAASVYRGPDGEVRVEIPIPVGLPAPVIIRERQADSSTGKDQIKPQEQPPPAPGAYPSITLQLTVSEVSAAVERAVALGAGLAAVPNSIVDPWGHHWQLVGLSR